MILSLCRASGLASSRCVRRALSSTAAGDDPILNRLPSRISESDRWECMRILWLATGSHRLDVGASLSVRENSPTLAVGGGDGITSSTTTSDGAASSPSTFLDPDGHGIDFNELAEAVRWRRSQRRRRRVKVNSASIARVLRDEERSERLAFTRPLPLPHIVALIEDFWNENATAAREIVQQQPHGNLR